jgi:hypothetical protein
MSQGFLVSYDTAMALYYQWQANGFRNPFNISRRNLMELSKINSFATYHKYISELVNFECINYTPSYHPGLGTLVKIIRGIN